MLAAEVGCLRACLLLLQHRNNLLFRKSLLLHSSVLNGPDSNPFWRKFSVAGHGSRSRRNHQSRRSPALATEMRGGDLRRRRVLLGQENIDRIRVHVGHFVGD